MGWPRQLLAYFFAKFNQQHREPVLGAKQLGWASCLASASGTTFLHLNALARLTGTTQGLRFHINAR